MIATTASMLIEALTDRRQAVQPAWLQIIDRRLAKKGGDQFISLLFRGVMFVFTTVYSSP